MLYVSRFQRLGLGFLPRASQGKKISGGCLKNGRKATRRGGLDFPPFGELAYNHHHPPLFARRAFPAKSSPTRTRTVSGAFGLISRNYDSYRFRVKTILSYFVDITE